MEARDHHWAVILGKESVLMCKTGIKIFYPLLWLGALKDKSVLQTAK